MDQLSLNNPLFATYVIAASLMILKAVSMSWLTVVPDDAERKKAVSAPPEDLQENAIQP